MPEVEEPKPKPWWRSRMFLGTLIACVPRIIESAGVFIPEPVKTLIQVLGGLVGVVGLRGVVERQTEAVKIQTAMLSKTENQTA